MFPMYRAIARRGMIVLFHMGDDRYDFSSPTRLRNVIERIGDLRAIAAHFGGYQRWEEAATMPRHERIYYDTSSSFAFINRDFALRMIDRFGSDHFMFGSDFPMWEPKVELERFLSLGLEKTIRDDILYNNFCRIFDLSDTE
jgi:predicted TIM-barrel fold metal-dependent hydrolase